MPSKFGLTYLGTAWKLISANEERLKALHWFGCGEVVNQKVTQREEQASNSWVRQILPKPDLHVPLIIIYQIRNSKQIKSSVHQFIQLPNQCFSVSCHLLKFSRSNNYLQLISITDCHNARNFIFSKIRQILVDLGLLIDVHHVYFYWKCCFKFFPFTFLRQCAMGQTAQIAFCFPCYLLNYVNKLTQQPSIGIVNSDNVLEFVHTPKPENQLMRAQSEFPKFGIQFGIMDPNLIQHVEHACATLAELGPQFEQIRALLYNPEVTEQGRKQLFRSLLEILKTFDSIKEILVSNGSHFNDPAQMVEALESNDLYKWARETMETDEAKISLD